MGKGTDKLYITHSEWASSDAYSASVGSGASTRAQRSGAPFQRLPFNYCAASLQPYKDPVCTADGTVFDAAAIGAWLAKRSTNPVDGRPLAKGDLIRLHLAHNDDGEPVDPVTFKAFTDHTHIVAVRHGDYANVFSWDTVDRMNVKAKVWRDLVDDVEFTRTDIITLQDPHGNGATRDLAGFKHVRDGEPTLATKPGGQEGDEAQGNVNIGALGRMGEKVLRAKEAVDRARREREAGGDVNRSSAHKALATKASSSASRPSMIQEKKKLAHNAAVYTTGRAAASFTSTGLTPETSGERAILSDEEWMLKPKRIKIKGFARIETNVGDLVVELHTDTAPKAVWNFVRLAQKGYYKNVEFHRNIKNFMIQGGDPTGTGRGGASVWGKPFNDEFEGPLTHNERGVMSMANKGKNTNSSQFFVLYRPARHLDKKHTIFAKVVDGLDVLDKMEARPTDDSDRPLDALVMRQVVVFVDPFAEFLKEKTQRDGAEQESAEIQRKGGTEDDKVTWTGKRIRQDGAVEDTSGGVGKYLEVAGDKEPPVEAVALSDTWQEPARKKTRTGGFGNFGNFDAW